VIRLLPFVVFQNPIDKAPVAGGPPTCTVTVLSDNVPSDKPFVSEMKSAVFVWETQVFEGTVYLCL
jgi:hypothetical protein